MSKDSTDLQDLALCIIAAAGLPSTRPVREDVAVKCLSLVEPSLRSWQREGLIIHESNGVLIKCPLFQKLWDFAMKLPSKRKLAIVPTTQLPEEDMDGEKVNNAVINKAPGKVQTPSVGS
jgi:hypothetical protein